MENKETSPTLPEELVSKIEKIAQWVIDNRYPKSELDKVSDFEMYHELVDKIKAITPNP